MHYQLYQESRKTICTILVMALLSFALCAQAKVTVTVTGVKNEAILENIESSLTIKQSKITKRTPKRHIQQLYMKGEEQIRMAVQPFGYYHAAVFPQIEQIDNDWIIHYDVSLGRAVRLNGIHVEIIGYGSHLDPLSLAKNPFPLQPGDKLDQISYEQYKQQLLTKAAAHGYFKAEFIKSDITIDLDSNTAEIDLIFDTGPPYFFGEVHFIQKDNFDVHFLERFLDFKPGEPYDEAKINALRSDLLNSGFFASADIITEKKNSDTEDRVPVDVYITPKDHFMYTAGAGYGTDTGARGHLGFEYRGITKTGQSLRLDIDPAQYIQTYSLHYRIPAARPATDYYELSGGYVNDVPQGRTIHSRTQQVAGSWVTGQPINAMRQILTLSYQHDEFDDEEGNTQSYLVLPRANWEWIRTEDRINPENGYRFQVEVRGTSEDLGSTTDFAQFEVTGKNITPLMEDTRLITRAQVGATNDRSIDQIPPSLRFFAGGDNSVRGYMYQSLGGRQVDENGNIQIIGGNYLFTGSAEIDRRVWRDLSLATFYDVGNAMIDLNEPLKQSIGIGFRYKTPIGPLRVDLAHPIHDDTNQVMLHLNLGPEL